MTTLVPRQADVCVAVCSCYTTLCVLSAAAKESWHDGGGHIYNQIGSVTSLFHCPIQTSPCTALFARNAVNIYCISCRWTWSIVASTWQLLPLLLLIASLTPESQSISESMHGSCSFVHELLQGIHMGTTVLASAKFVTRTTGICRMHVAPLGSDLMHKLHSQHNAVKTLQRLIESLDILY